MKQKQALKQIKICQFCGEKIILKNGSYNGHHCSGKKAFNNGCKHTVYNLDKLMFYDEEEDDFCVEFKVWEDFKRAYFNNKV